MSQHPAGIERGGLNASFEADEALKSNLIVETQLLITQQQSDAAADRFARAAEIEERLSARCADRGLREKSWVHLFSAASCRARAGDFHTAIGLGDQLLAETVCRRASANAFWNSPTRSVDAARNGQLGWA
jgi:hypothetical protein